MSERWDDQEKRRFWLQVVALCLILLPPLLLYAAVSAGLIWVTWVLMTIIAGGMFLGMWVL
jgi:hypothetical protein